MALFRYNQGFVQRSKGGSAVAKSAYNSRVDIKDERLNKTHYYARNKDNDLVHAEVIAPHNAPGWAKDRTSLWNMAEKKENRKNSQTAITVGVALPRELNPEQNIELLRDFIRKQYTSKGIVADFAIHDPKAKEGETNPHAHILLTTRKIKGDSFDTHKAREWQTKNQLNWFRESWATIQNGHLAKAGFDNIKVDHRTLKEMGIDRQPTKHEGKILTSQKRAEIELNEQGKKYDRIYENVLIGNENLSNEYAKDYQPEESYQREIENLEAPENLSPEEIWLRNDIKQRSFLSEEHQSSRFTRFNGIIQKTAEKTIELVTSVKDSLIEKIAGMINNENNDRDIDYEFER